MIRAAAGFVLVCLTFAVATPATATERAEATTGTTTAAMPALDGAPATLANAPWMRDHGMPGQARTGKTLNVLFASYGVLQGLDMYSTIAARNHGAREVNPLLNTGYTEAFAVKAALTAVTYVTTRAMGKKNKKAAVVTMMILNGVTAAVVANNLKNAGR